ncbi:MAG: hypothetical protein IAE95_02780 [Chitinophagaceae bacterium]|nr:hypothetical protein [Chitinophagaceae bacterium]
MKTRIYIFAFMCAAFMTAGSVAATAQIETGDHRGKTYKKKHYKGSEAITEQAESSKGKETKKYDEQDSGDDGESVDQGNYRKSERSRKREMRKHGHKEKWSRYSEVQSARMSK